MVARQTTTVLYFYNNYTKQTYAILCLICKTESSKHLPAAPIDLIIDNVIYTRVKAFIIAIS